MMRRSYQQFLVGLLSLVLLNAAGCAERQPPASSGSASAPAHDFRAGEIVETASQHVISLEQLMTALLRQEVIYLGEEHHNHFHIESALTLLNQLSRAGRRPVVAMEMFGWESQPLLDRYVQGDELSRQDFLSQAGWSQNWGGPFETYEPLVAFAKTAHTRLLALNPPKPLVRMIAKKGLEQARREAEWTRWRLEEETIVDDPSYRQKIFEQLRACHGGGSDEMYQTMYEASMVRDEGMAKTIVGEIGSLRRGDPAAGPVVSYTGGGHIQYNLPVPQRVARRLDGEIRQTSIYMTSYEPARADELREMFASRIADYIWLTPVGAEGMPRRCR
ncbi:MAG TPA: ChaN family lipoprotein [Nitrospira sp.]|nr:ChaN family lipoprotein [Nitrospira sp.]